jgi:hypothetical protein
MLQTAERLWADLRDLLRIEVESGHSFEQKVSRIRPMVDDRAQLGNGHTEITGDALYFPFSAAMQLRPHIPLGPTFAPLQHGSNH